MRQSHFAFERAFPDLGPSPARLRQRCARPGVVLAVAIDLRAPEIGPCRWHPEKMAVVAVPETALRHDDSPVARKDDIGFAGQRLVVKPKPESGCMKPLPQDHFRSGVLRPDT